MAIAVEPEMSVIETGEGDRRFSSQSDGEDDDSDGDVYKVFTQLRKRRRSLIQANTKQSKRQKGEKGDEAFDIDDYRNMKPDEEVPKFESQDQILQHVQKHKQIIQEVKFQPWRMKVKKNTVKIAKDRVRQFEGRLSRRHGYQEQGERYWRQFRRLWRNFVIFFLPWEVRIKTIESHFGSTVASYFIFLRWLLAVNLLYALLWLLVVLPEIFVGETGGARKTVPESEKGNALDFDTIWDFNGYIKYSVLFYGYYGDSESIGNGYQLPLAYILVGLATYAVSFIIILRKMAKNARMSKMASPQDQFTFCWKLFTGWDFMIGNAETADKTVAANATSFREAIIEEQEKERKGDRRPVTICLRILANLLVISILCGSGYAIYYVVQRSQEFERVTDKSTLSWWENNEVSIVVTLITMICPSVFELIGGMERYHPRVALRWQLARIMVLYMGNLYTLIIALLGRVSDLTEKSRADFTRNSLTLDYLRQELSGLRNSSYYTSPLNHTGYIEARNESISELVGNISRINDQLSTLGPDDCWETVVGQEFFKLVFFDLVAVILGTLGGDFLRAIMVRYLNPCWCWDLEMKFPEYPEFKIAENVLHLVYNQGMVWMGCFYSPLLAAFNVLKLVITLYMRAWAVMTCNAPHERIFRASRSNNFFLTLLLLMLFLCVLAFGYSVVSIPPSHNCGPFSQLDSILDVIGYSMDETFPPWLLAVVDYMNTAGVVVPLILFLIMIIYYLVALSGSYKEANNDLRIQLEHERTANRRKHYLLISTHNNRNKTKPRRRPRNAVPVLPLVPADHKLKKVSAGGQERQISVAKADEIQNNFCRSVSPSNSSSDIRHIPLPSGQQITVIKKSVSVEHQAVRINLSADEDVVVPAGMRARYYYRGQPVSQEVWMILKQRALDKYRRRTAHARIVPTSNFHTAKPESPDKRNYAPAPQTYTTERENGERAEEDDEDDADDDGDDGDDDENGFEEHGALDPFVILGPPVMTSESDTTTTLNDEDDDDDGQFSTDEKSPSFHNAAAGGTGGVDRQQITRGNNSVREERIKQWVKASQKRRAVSDREGPDREEGVETAAKEKGPSPKNGRREPEGQESVKEKSQKSRVQHGRNGKEKKNQKRGKGPPAIEECDTAQRNTKLEDDTNADSGKSQATLGHSGSDSGGTVQENKSDARTSNENVSGPVETGKALKNDLSTVDIVEKDALIARTRNNAGAGRREEPRAHATWEVNRKKRNSRVLEVDLRSEFTEEFDDADNSLLIRDDGAKAGFVNPLYADNVHQGNAERDESPQTQNSDDYFSGEVRTGFAQRENMLRNIKTLRNKEQGDDGSDKSSDHSEDAIRQTFEAMKRGKMGTIATIDINI